MQLIIALRNYMLTSNMWIEKQRTRTQALRIVTWHFLSTRAHNYVKIAISKEIYSYWPLKPRWSPNPIGTRFAFAHHVRSWSCQESPREAPARVIRLARFDGRECCFDVKSGLAAVVARLDPCVCRFWYALNNERMFLLPYSVRSLLGIGMNESRAMRWISVFGALCCMARAPWICTLSVSFV